MKRIITLTDQAPVQIQGEDWPELTVAHRRWASPKTGVVKHWDLRARQHKDGRAIIHAFYQKRREGTRVRTVRHGKFLTAAQVLEDSAAIVQAIMDVAMLMHRDVPDEDADCFIDLEQAAIAGMPVTELE